MNDDFSGPPGMDNFDGIKIEQPQAGPKGERHGCPASGQRQGCRTGARPVKIERMRVTLQKAKSWGAPCRPGG